MAVQSILGAALVLVNKSGLILDHRGNPIPRREVKRIAARYESAQTTPENIRQWTNVDQLSAKYSNSRDVRFHLRLRARYEVANNSYAAGIVTTLANDCVGTGPRLQIQTDDEETNERVEEAWEAWTCETRLPAKLHTIRRAKCVDGEAFVMFTNNPKFTTPSQLDLRLIETDQILTPFLNPIDPKATDGIFYDDHQNPIQYSLLKRHPGDFYNVGMLADLIDARRVIHWFDAQRPGETRGVPELTPAISLFANLRRFLMAVLAAAETAADFAAVLENDQPPDMGPDDTTQVVPWEGVPIERRQMLTIPAGWKMSQFRAEQPSTTYEMIKREIISEIARCLLIPYGIAAGNSSSYNFSSAQLDHQQYFRQIAITQKTVERVILERIFVEWLDEMNLAADWFPGGSGRVEGWPHTWYWDAIRAVDPVKEAQAQELRLKMRLTTYASEYARQGLDWRERFDQVAAEQEYAKELGVPIYEQPAAATAPLARVAIMPDPGATDEGTEEP